MCYFVGSNRASLNAVVSSKQESFFMSEHNGGRGGDPNKGPGKPTPPPPPQSPPPKPKK